MNDQGLALLDVQNLVFGYVENPVLKGLSLSMGRGEVFCLLGPNGCGKTTLLDCILGTLRTYRGAIHVAGRENRTLRPGRIARYISYVPQHHEQTFPFTTLEVVKMGRTVHTGLFSSPSAADERIANEAMERVGISHLKSRPYTQLSGGEGQLVMIARALTQETPLICMDEPTAHLDFRNELLVLETIVEMVKDLRISVIIATHLPNHAFYFENHSLKTKVALLHKGTFLSKGAAKDVLDEDRMQTLYGVRTAVVSHRLDHGRTIKQVIPIRTI